MPPENQPLLSRPSLPSTTTNKAFLAGMNAPHPELTKVLLVESASSAQKTIQVENNYLARRLGGWTLLGGFWAWVFFGETTTKFIVLLQAINAPIGSNPNAMKFVEIGTIGTNAPFNGVVSIETIELVLNHVARFRKYGYTHATLTVLNTGLILVEIAGASIASLSFYAQILDAPAVTLAFSAFQILPNTISGMAGIEKMALMVGEIAIDRIKILRGTMTHKEHYSKSVKALLTNTSVTKKRAIVELIKQIKAQSIDPKSYQAQALHTIFQRIAATQEDLPTFLSKLRRSIFPATPHDHKHKLLSVEEKKAIAALIVDIIQDENLPLSPETNLILSFVLTAFQFPSLYGVMYLGNKELAQYLKNTILAGIENAYFPHIVLSGMLESFSLNTLSKIPTYRNNPIFVAGNLGHLAGSGAFLTTFMVLLSVSWGGAGPAILDAILNEGLETIFLSAYNWFVLNANSVVLSNGMASFGLVLLLYISVSIGFFAADSLLNAVTADKVISQCSATITELFNEEHPEIMQHIVDNAPQLPAPPELRPSLAAVRMD